MYLSSSSRWKISLKLNWLRTSMVGKSSLSSSNSSLIFSKAYSSDFIFLASLRKLSRSTETSDDFRLLSRYKKFLFWDRMRLMFSMFKSIVKRRSGTSEPLTLTVSGYFYQYVCTDQWVYWWKTYHKVAQKTKYKLQIAWSLLQVDWPCLHLETNKRRRFWRMTRWHPRRPSPRASRNPFWRKSFRDVYLTQDGSDSLSVLLFYFGLGVDLVYDFYEGKQSTFCCLSVDSGYFGQ